MNIIKKPVWSRVVYVVADYLYWCQNCRMDTPGFYECARCGRARR
jgi:predicted RNA-binding protein with PUA domain